ncbi:MAG: hypothetical protein U9Q83_02820 [Bacteroidota bacterium]|nr:hypothetical protein [Bacteroidota bacterium]
METKDFDIKEYLESNPISKNVFDSCFRQDKNKYYFSHKLEKFEKIDSPQQLQDIIMYDYPSLIKEDIDSKGKPKRSLNLPTEFLNLTFFINSIDLVITEIDIFQTESVKIEKFDKTLTIITNQLLMREPEKIVGLTEETCEVIINDYKDHFEELDKFLEWIVACRFTSNRRSSYLHLRVSAGFGKSFITAVFEKLGIVTECRYEDFKSPSSLNPNELRNSWILLIDEFTIFKKEFKNFTNNMIVDAKNQLRTKATLYSKVFLSAEQSPSFEDGVDKQITDRVNQIDVESVSLESRDVYKQYSNTVYLTCLSRYIYLYLKNKIKFYKSLGKVEADKHATSVLNSFLDSHKLKVESLDYILFQLFYSKILHLKNTVDFESLTKNELEIKQKYLVPTANNCIVVKSVKKVFQLIVADEDENFAKKAKYKANALDSILKVDKSLFTKQHKSNGENHRGLLIDPLTFVEVIEDSKTILKKRIDTLEQCPF